MNYRLEPPDRFDDLNQFDLRDVEEQSGTFDPRDGVVVREDEDRAHRRMENYLDRLLSEALKADRLSDLQKAQRLLELINVRCMEHLKLVGEREEQIVKDENRQLPSWVA